VRAVRAVTREVEGDHEGSEALLRTLCGHTVTTELLAPGFRTPRPHGPPLGPARGGPGGERPTVVLDNGGGWLKAGFAGQASPLCVVPNLVAKAKGVPRRFVADQVDLCEDVQVRTMLYWSVQVRLWSVWGLYWSHRHGCGPYLHGCTSLGILVHWQGAQWCTGRGHTGALAGRIMVHWQGAEWYTGRGTVMHWHERCWCACPAHAVQRLTGGRVSVCPCSAWDQ